MIKSPADDIAPTERQDARDLQAQLYREIGISAVAAALSFVNPPDPPAARPPDRDRSAMVRIEPRAA